jgi:hypothetical protein
MAQRSLGWLRWIRALISFTLLLNILFNYGSFCEIRHCATFDDVLSDTIHVHPVVTSLFQMLNSFLQDFLVSHKFCQFYI